jgi:hypothetical protein
MANFDGFFPDEKGVLKKKIVLKVSDYRSAEVQGKFLAKKGLWVSEYRIESGLNCGGHAFPSKGFLMGPILEEFHTRKAELTGNLSELYRKGLGDRSSLATGETTNTRITVQGGIGTAEEDSFLHKYYEVDATGWGTPFLLVPEAANVDEAHLEKLAAANSEKEVYLSAASPMGIPFWTLHAAASEEQRRERIEAGKPGSPCVKGHGAIYNTEFTEIPECTATRKYIKRKLAYLEQQELSDEQRKILTDDVLAKACICHELSGGATLMLDIDEKAHPAVCCGPNIMHFDKVATLEEMVDHIYGRLNLMLNGSRPHMFIKELSLYVEYLRKEMEKFSIDLQTAGPKYFAEFRDNLQKGIDYYGQLAEEFVDEKRQGFLDELKVQSELLEDLFAKYKAKLAETG